MLGRRYPRVAADEKRQVICSGLQLGRTRISSGVGRDATKLWTEALRCGNRKDIIKRIGDGRSPGEVEGW